MASKIPFVLGLGAGYVLGTRAGRAQYERIKATATRFAEQPRVRETVDNASARATAFAKEQGEALTDRVVETVKERVFSGSSSRSKADGPTRTVKTTSYEPVTVDDAEVRSVED